MLSALDAAEEARAAPKPQAEMVRAFKTLKVEGDPIQAQPPQQPQEEGAPAPAAAEGPALPGPTSLKVHAHLSKLFWRLVDEAWDLPSLMLALADALPGSFDRPIDCGLYLSMDYAPKEHRALEKGAVESEQLYYISVGGGDAPTDESRRGRRAAAKAARRTRRRLTLVMRRRTLPKKEEDPVNESRVMRLYTAPVGVRLALADGCRTDEILEELPLPAELIEMGADGEAPQWLPSKTAEEMQQKEAGALGNPARPPCYQAIDYSYRLDAPPSRHQLASSSSAHTTGRSSPCPSVRSSRSF